MVKVIVGRRGFQVRRILMSRLLLLVVITLVLGAMAWLIQGLESRGQERADAQGATTAEVIAATVVRPRLGASDLARGQLSAEDLTGLRDDVDQLRDDGQLLGLRVWSLDGTPLFDGSPASGALQPSDSDLVRARQGKLWAASGQAADGQSQLRVYLPLSTAEQNAGSRGALVQVVLPHGDLTAAAQDRLLRQQASVVVIFGLVIVGLVWLRHRLLRRERHARHDPLTGLLNRRALYEDARGLLAKASFKRPLAFLLLDLSEFKSVNDTLGHTAGDLLLQRVAATLQAAVRPEDLVVRLGGDEFGVLLAHLPDTAAAQGRAEQLLRRLREAPFTVEGVDLSVDASIGVALAPEHGRTLPELLQRADVAMYQAKRSRRGTAVYDPRTDQHTVGQLAMVTDLRRALDNDEFVLHYQPKVSLRDMQVTSVEALVRWRHPTRGLLPPGEFLPVLERSGLMQPLTRWVLRQAIQQAASWRRAGMPLQVAVNISPRSLLQDDLPARVLAALLAAELPASLLQLEITETAVMTNPERAAFVLTQLQSRGVEVAIDDFGAGYTSLAFLRILPITALKIDRSLIKDMLDQEADEAVTSAVTDLAHRLGFSVIAEGVESLALLDRLAALGCDQVQGYVISAPLPPAALEGWLADWQARRSTPVETAAAS
ncbi:putative bifunctional diguanylate cyclase/phosphodiesterase [Blastococcus tunisiensis]|uniref:Diguanylate cyclase (GGDEF) domain-containing protein n=2 Tax=Blastococcus TaxID=38501 RepID=A0A1I2EIJ6_9ACTN|nr:EAL domain-containing protein [Blastococcus sp. DSM 46838]SFE92685.1 diguanylate cyclase (GGDEF) domain-containing protein [Blastococcus sp. DSM 46838]